MRLSEFELQQQRDTHKRLSWRGRRRFRPRWKSGWNVMLLSSYVLIGLGMWWLWTIFGPVARAEATFQWKSSLHALSEADYAWAEKLLPKINFELVPPEITQDMGLVIPKLYIEEQIVQDVDPTNKAVYMPALREGIAHAAGSNKPGEGGLGYYFAHSSGLDAPMHGGNAVFYLLNKLESGDEVRIYRGGERHTYQVTTKWVTRADDLGFLRESYDAETIVLQTCWPVGTSRNRLLVKAERV